MDAALETETGYRMRQADDLDAALQAGFTITMGDVTVEAFRDLRTLQAERARYEQEHANPTTGAV